MPSSISIEAPGVFISERVWEILTRQFNLFDYRQRRRGDELDCALMAIHLGQLNFFDRQEAAGAGNGTGAVPLAALGAQSILESSTSEVAACLNCSARAVRRAAIEERLTGVLVGGRWRFQHQDVTRWTAVRAAKG